MKLPLPRGGYNRPDEIEKNRQIEAADKQNHKKNRDVEIGQGRLILTSPDGNRWSVEVDNAGALSTTAL